MTDNSKTLDEKVWGKLLQQNRDAYAAVSLVGGNSVQDSYKYNTQRILDEQKQLIEIFIDEDEAEE